MIKVAKFDVGDVVIDTLNKMAIVRKNYNEYRYMEAQYNNIYIEVTEWDANEYGLEHGWLKADDNEISDWNKKVLNPIGLEYDKSLKNIVAIC